MGTLSIVGYEKDVNCQHCNKFLKHGIRLDNGQVVGAACFENQLTIEKVYQGKKFKMGTQAIIKLAKIAEYVSPAEWSRRYGVSAHDFSYLAK